MGRKVADKFEEIFEEMFNEAREEVLDALKENSEFSSWETLKEYWVKNNADKKLIERFIPTETKDKNNIIKLHGTEITNALDNHSSKDEEKGIYFFFYDELYEELNIWGEDLIDYVNEKRDETSGEVDELERQLEDAEYADDEEVVYRIEAELNAFDVEEELQGFIDDLDINSV
jgi:hypothetical protein